MHRHDANGFPWMLQITRVQRSNAMVPQVCRANPLDHHSFAAATLLMQKVVTTPNSGAGRCIAGRSTYWQQCLGMLPEWQWQYSSSSAHMGVRFHTCHVKFSWFHFCMRNSSCLTTGRLLLSPGESYGQTLQSLQWSTRGAQHSLLLARIAHAVRLQTVSPSICWY